MRIIQRLGALDKGSILGWLLVGFLSGAAGVSIYYAQSGLHCSYGPTFQCTQRARVGVTEVSQPVVYMLPEITIEGSPPQE